MASLASPFGTPRGRPPHGGGLRSPFTVPRAADGTSRLHERALHKVEVSLSRSQGEVGELSQKLTAANVEVQALRAQLDTRTKELTYARRSLDRTKHEKAGLQTEVDSTKDTLRRLEAKMSRSGSLPTDSTLILNERCQQMAARLEQEEDSARSQKREMQRLQDEVATLKEALKMRGEVGALQEEIIQVRGERMQLAIELHDVKESLRTSQQTEQHSRLVTAETAAEATAVLDELRLVEAERASAVSRADKHGSEVENLLVKGAELEQRMEQMSRQLRLTEDELGRMSRERDGLLRQRESNEASIDRLQGELERRDENSRVELRLLTEKHEQACTQLRARDYENKQMREHLADVTSQLSHSTSRQQELSQDLHIAETRLEAAGEEAAMLQRQREEAQSQLSEQRAALERTSASLASSEESGSARMLIISQRLEVALQELQVAFHDRDRLRSALDEALSRCAASLVAKQLAEEERNLMQQQLAAARVRSVETS